MVNEIKLHQKLMSYLLISIPLLLITGPFLSDLAVVLLCILYLFNCPLNKFKTLFKNYFFIFFLSFYILCIFSSLLSDYPLISTFKSIFYIRFLIFALAIVYVLKNNPNTLDKLFISIFICFVILIFDGFYQFIFKKNIFGFEMYEDRISSFFKDELIYGSYLSKFFPIFLSLFFIYKNKGIKLNIFFSIILILTIFMITLSGERAALFLIILTLIFLFMMLKINIKILTTFLIVILLGVSSILTFNENVKNRVINFTKNQIITKDKIYFFSKDHAGHYYAAIDIYKENNKIIGIGPKNFRNYCYNNQKYQNLPFICTSHPHNTYIQILTETGMLGFLILLTTFFLLIYLSSRHFYFKFFKKEFKYSNFQVSLFAFYVMILWPIVPTGNFFNNYLSIIYYIPLGLLIWSNKNQKLIKF